MCLGILELQVAGGGSQPDPLGKPRTLIISHGGRCLQPEHQLARSPRRKGSRVPPPPQSPIAGSQPRAQSPPTGNIPGPPLPGSLPPSRCCLGSVRPQLPARCWGAVRISEDPGVRCSEREEAGTLGRPEVGGSGRRLQRLPRATFKLAPASRRRHLGSFARLALREPAGRPPLGECPQVCPSPFTHALLAEWRCSVGTPG